MWSSGQETNHRTRTSDRLVSSSSSSSSSSSVLPQTPRRRSMEEVWKDISLATLHQERPLTPSIPLEPHHSHQPHAHAHAHAHAPCLRGMILQDFLARAFKDAVPTVASSPEGAPLPPPPPPALPHTTLSLSSGMDCQPLGSAAIHNTSTTRANSSSNSDGSHAHQPPFSFSGAYTDAVMGSPPPAGIFSFCPKKRTSLESSSTESDPRHKRMIKNRESAARSRARKQAYTNELELEVTHLQEENAKLRKQYEELRSAMEAQLAPKKSLKRTSSAPF